ncbi:hypothetical protein L829_3911 [Mycobacteroides abscessus MAB_030201_1075]|uniref:Ferredoxin n=1 Tax=Mycobacteroides abscessus MAB_030201_1075 TaxID=1335410 RepID=A0A829PSZ4_9MYCO|nr:ferredoxin [Mycobacteroides abscessus]ETZ73927.1 hypothetical protein L835_1006 [Mycobacteroides abscessus MAB_110811_1470]ETZ90329.1 hypothetical protein L829_3911 [Mycobacteroides abscessus MAB_030201_1075]ETZ92873.1 hypothetical protein L828_1038 [Mycobacteroides abscessus MAB_030201_1061]
MQKQSFAITVDDGVCMGAGYCYRSYPQLFAAAADGTSLALASAGGELLDDATRASQLCPSGAIEIHPGKD